MSIWPRCRFAIVFVFLAWGCICPEHGLAQLPRQSSDDTAVVTVEDIQKNIEKVERSKDIDDATKASILNLYQEAMQDVIRAASWMEKSQVFQQTKESAARDIEQARDDLSAGKRVITVDVPQDASVKQLERALAEAEARMNDAKKTLSAAEAEPRRRAIRRLEVERLLKEARRLAAVLERQRAALVSSKNKTNGPIDLARKTAVRAALHTAKLEIDGYSKELAAHEATIDLLPLNHDLAVREMSQAKAVVVLLKNRLSQARRQEAKEQILKASQGATMADPSLQKIAKDNEELAGERHTIIENSSQKAEMLDSRRRELAKIEREYEGIQDKLKSVGRSKTIELFLKTQRITGPDSHDYLESIAARQEETLKAQSRMIDLANKRTELADEEDMLDESLEDSEDALTSSEDEEQLKRAKRQLVQTQKEYVDQLAKEYYRYFNTLLELDTTEQELVDKIDSYNDYIDEQVLWIRSTTPIWDMKEWQKSLNLKSVLNSSFWSDLLQAGTSDFKIHPILWIGGVLVVVLLTLIRRRAKPALRELGARAEVASMQQFLPTFQAMLLTLLLTMPVSGLMAFVAWRLSDGIGVSESVRALAYGIWATLFVFLPLEFSRRMCSVQGLAESHFGWSSSAVTRIRHLVMQMILLTLPLVLISATLNKMPNAQWQNSIGRICFILSLCIVAFIMHRILRRRSEVYISFFAKHPDKWISRVFLLGYVLMVVMPVLLVLFSACGYYFTAWDLASRWLQTVVLMLSLLVLGAFFLRWILVVRRRLAINRARQQREEMQAAEAAMTHEGESEEKPEIPVVDVGPDLATINMQSRRFLFVVLGIAGAIGLWFIWDDVFPALGILKYVEIGKVSGGSAMTISRTITLADLAGALVIAGLTLIAARNISGLLEMSLWQHLSIDKGLCYAITAVCRYILIAVGIIWVCNYVGLSWSKLQWILAAMSVGLGFGLQEIFANFVSGMVILFERPIRIGDIITIGDATGRVSRIQMRATTIIDWDKKELVVPNKEFTTGRLLNWTLTDTVNRLVIEVGVSYRSDPDKVREILLKCAADHPQVVDDPKPICIFREFGSSALMFSLRIYLASMKGRLNVIHDMHSAIHRALREAGIEIAYPQLDLHVRSGLKDAIIEA
ncbi:MAG: mechanosensitive ion channel [Pirellulales bacterium]|nr:mechanosensitive ion channel [Pirellulales bacterium]